MRPRSRIISPDAYLDGPRAGVAGWLVASTFLPQPTWRD
jgi:hypothetical protein